MRTSRLVPNRSGGRTEQGERDIGPAATWSADVAVGIRGWCGALLQSRVGGALTKLIATEGDHCHVGPP